MADAKTQKQELMDMLTRIFADSVAEETELNVLIAFLSSGTMKPTEVQEVMTNFVQNTWKITIADGVVTDEEKKRLRSIVDSLGLQHSDFIPNGWRRALAK
jgi:tellurite resistance protein